MNKWVKGSRNEETDVKYIEKKIKNKKHLPVQGKKEKVWTSIVNVSCLFGKDYFVTFYCNNLFQHNKPTLVSLYTFGFTRIKGRRDGLDENTIQTLEVNQENLQSKKDKICCFIWWLCLCVPRDVRL